MTDQTNTQDDETKFVVVFDQKANKQVRIPYNTLTLSDFRHRVASQLFPMTLQGAPEETPELIRLIWCGKELKDGAMWHSGMIDDIKDTMDDLDPGVDRETGLPMIHALVTGGSSS